VPVAHEQQDVPRPDVAAITAAASAAVGQPLTDAVVLAGGSGRSTVLRCRVDDQSTAIVKSYPRNGEGRSSFAAEAAGLHVASRTDLAPALLGADPDRLTVVMSDLGSGGSLADALLGGSASAASSAVLNWSRACGALSAAAGRGQQEFDSLKAGYLRGHDDETYMAGLGNRILHAAEAVDEIGLAPPDGLRAELAEVAAAAGSDRYAVFSPGDICPDNNMLSGDAIKFLDFESAGFHSAFLDAAYITMPFSTCWCVFRLPAELTAAAEAAYRSAVCAVRPELAGDSEWQAGVRCGAAAWTLSSLSWLLRSAIEADAPTDPDAESPRTRQLIRYRWQTLARELETAGELPAITELMRSLLAVTEKWQAPELPLYPAFR
jgi:hypothetical protein